MTVFPLLGRVLRFTALRWALVFLLLAAQQAALTHALGHAAGHAHESVAALHEQPHEAHGDGLEEHGDSAGRIVSGQCAFDLVYSQVLGGMHAGYTLHVAADGTVAHALPALPSLTATAEVPYDSRGPPHFS